MSDNDYTLGSDGEQKTIPVPEVTYKPQLPEGYRPKIGLIGCGGITDFHLQGYTKAGLDVVALCDLNLDNAAKRQKEFYPEAKLYQDYEQVLAREDIDVVDIALHPEPRLPVIEASLKAGKHVLSQKPFVLDLDEGQRIVELADAEGVKLAINQNGRWAPYVRYTTQLIRQGFVGDVQTVNFRLNWDHTWIQGKDFEYIHHILLYDFAIHWYDMMRLYMGDKPAKSVFAAIEATKNQPIKPALTGASVCRFENGIGSLHLDGASLKEGGSEGFMVSGSEGVISGNGGVCEIDELELRNNEGACKVSLEGKWFPDGLLGAMGELLSAIAEDREPENSARNNLKSLELAFAAIESADTGNAVVPGTARRLGERCKVVK